MRVFTTFDNCVQYSIVYQHFKANYFGFKVQVLVTISRDVTLQTLVQAKQFLNDISSAVRRH